MPSVSTTELLDAITPDGFRAELCRRSFADFVATFWPDVEPTRELLPSVAVDGINAVLQEAGEHGGRWAISCPPGVSKSLLCSVLFPAWLLLRSRGQARIMGGSYSWDFATRDARRCRDLIQSPAYQALVANEWAIRDDADRNRTTGPRAVVGAWSHPWKARRPGNASPCRY
jgi:hypothetical protein